MANPAQDLTHLPGESFENYIARTSQIQGVKNPLMNGQNPPPVAPQVAPNLGSTPLVQPVPTAGNESTTPQQPQQETSPFALSQVMSSIEAKVKSNNSLMSQRNLILKQLYDQPLTEDEKKQLDPTLLSAINSGDRNLIDTQLRLISDQVAGRNGTLDQSVQYLTKAYTDEQQNIEKKRQDAINNVIKFAAQYGDNASEAMKSLYGQGYLDQLKAQGIDIASYAAIPTINQGRYGVGGSTYNIDIPTGTIASSTNNPLNIKFSPTTQTYGGTDSGIAGQDGGTFAAFDSPDSGLQAGIQLLKSPIYADLTIDQAMKKWSNSGYGAEVSSSLKPSQKISSLSDDQMHQLVSDMAKRESGTNVEQTESDIQVQADAIERGDLPPPNPATGRSSIATQKLFSELSRRGVDVGKAYLDYQAALKTVASLNGPQMVRFRGLATSVVNTIDEVKTLATKMDQSGLTKLNQAQLAEVVNVEGNSERGQLASQYLGAVNTLKEEFANLANGGYAPTEAAFSLANSQINANYGVKQLTSSLDEVQRLINFRVQALTSVQPTTLGVPTGTDTPGGGTGAPTGGSNNMTTPGGNAVTITSN